MFISFLLPTRRLCGGVDQSEDVVEDKVAASSIGHELESLGVAHGSLLLVDLRIHHQKVSSQDSKAECVPKVCRRQGPGYRQPRSRAGRQDWRPRAGLC